MQDYLTTEKAAQKLGICRRHVVHLIHQHQIEAIKPGQQWFIGSKEIERYKAKRVENKESNKSVKD